MSPESSADRASQARDEASSVRRQQDPEGAKEAARSKSAMQEADRRGREPDDPALREAGLTGYAGFSDLFADKGASDLRKIYDRAVRDMETQAFKQLHPTLKNQVVDMARAARDALAKTSTRDAAVETGARGGRYYVSATGAKVNVKSNPGPVHLGHMRNQTFHQGLPMSVHLNEPRRK